MKKIISMMLCMAIMFSLVACGSKTETSSTDNNTSLTTEEGTNNVQGGSEETNGSESSTSVTPDNAGNESSGEYTKIGAALVETFLQEAGSTTDLLNLAEKLGAASDAAEGPALMIEAVQEGYLPGFSEDVTGFSAGVAFIPMIGSIPYAGYVFEVDDPGTFLETIKAIADPRWNICTEAQETVYEISGNYVLFAMTPGDEE